VLPPRYGIVITPVSYSSATMEGKQKRMNYLYAAYAGHAIPW
jgi:hypothetical protein